MPYNTFSNVQAAINKVAQDVRQMLQATANAPAQPLLIDYCNRAHAEILRLSRWHFMLSETQYFMTTFGQTDYWIGAKGTNPGGTVDTALNLTDVDRLKSRSVRDYSNNRTLGKEAAQPLANSLNWKSGQPRLGRPATYVQDNNDPDILHIYPASDNNNVFSPVPLPPALTYAAGGTLAQRTYYVRITFLDSIGGESTGSQQSTYITIPADNLLTVASPKLLFSANASGVQYSSYKIYAAQASTVNGSAENLETYPATVAIATNWTEPSTGLTTGGASVPTSSTLAPMEGYIIGFRYLKDRKTLSATTDPLQIPDDYLDVLVHGINALAWSFLEKDEQFQKEKALFDAGKVQMISDKNQQRDTDFIQPDPGTMVNDATTNLQGSLWF